MRDPLLGVNPPLGTYWDVTSTTRLCFVAWIHLFMYDGLHPTCTLRRCVKIPMHEHKSVSCHVPLGLYSFANRLPVHVSSFCQVYMTWKISSKLWMASFNPIMPDPPFGTISPCSDPGKNGLRRWSCKASRVCVHCRLSFRGIGGNQANV